MNTPAFVQGFFRYAVGTRSPRELFSLWWQLVRWRPQVLVYLGAARGIESARRDALFFRLCGISTQIGVPLTEPMQHNLPALDGALEPEAGRLTRNLASLGPPMLQDPRSWDLHLTQAEHVRASEALISAGDLPVIAVSVGTKVQAKDWGRDNWRDLLTRLAALYPAHALALAGAPEEAAASDFAAAHWTQAGGAPVINLCGTLTPRESAAVFARSRIFLGHDSGPMHLAAAVQTPCVAIFAARNIPASGFPTDASTACSTITWTAPAAASKPASSSERSASPRSPSRKSSRRSARQSTSCRNSPGECDDSPRSLITPMLPDLHAILNLLEGGFRELRILVVGDIMLDRYITGEVDRISPEAPVPVLRHAQRYERAGGAANVAMNLAGLGAQAFLAGFWGSDAEQTALASLLDEAKIDTLGVVSTAMPTISKTRIVGRSQQLLRLDIESRDQPTAEDAERLAERVHGLLPKVNAIILSDYAKGVLSSQLSAEIIASARRHAIPVFVDPKTPDLSKYSGALTICPNLHELALATRISVHQTDDLLAAGQALAAEHDLQFLTVTMSEKGIAILRPGSIERSPARAREVFDVSGAGDTVIATLAAAVAGGLPVRTAVELANVAAGIVVGKTGTVPIAAHELVAELTPSSGVTAGEKILDLERITRRVAEWRATGQTIVFTNGCFDLLHVGHITLLEDCRRFGSKLVLGLNADISVSRLKGPSRPIVAERERARVMAALAAVDAVVLFEGDTPLELIRALRPDVLVKGGDYTVDTVVGHEEVLAAGGRVEIVPTVEGFSTTNIVKKLTTPGIPPRRSSFDHRHRRRRLHRLKPRPSTQRHRPHRHPRRR